MDMPFFDLGVNVTIKGLGVPTVDVNPEGAPEESNQAEACSKLPFRR
jgi:hypothetical protein